MGFLFRVSIVAVVISFSCFADVKIPGHLYTRWVEAKEIKKLEKKDLSYHCKKIQCFKYKDSYEYVIAEEDVYKDEALSEKSGKIVSVYRPKIITRPIKSTPGPIPGCTTRIVTPSLIRTYDDYIIASRYDANPYDNNVSNNNLCNQFYFDGTNYFPIDISGLQAFKIKNQKGEVVSFTDNEKRKYFIKKTNDDSHLDFIGYDEGLFFRTPFTSEIMTTFYSSEEANMWTSYKRSSFKGGFKKAVVEFLSAPNDMKKFLNLYGERNFLKLWLQPSDNGITFINLSPMLESFPKTKDAHKDLYSSNASSMKCHPSYVVEGTYLNYNFLSACKRSSVEPEKAFLTWDEILKISETSELPKLVGNRLSYTSEQNGISSLYFKIKTTHYSLNINVDYQIYPVPHLEFISKYLKGEKIAKESIPKEFLSDCHETYKGQKLSCEIVNIIKYIDAEEEDE